MQAMRSSDQLDRRTSFAVRGDTGHRGTKFDRLMSRRIGLTTNNAVAATATF